MSDEMLPSQERVEITSARVFDVDGDPAGQWLHIVDYVDFDGNVDGDLETDCIAEARARAVTLAKRFHCSIVDFSFPYEAQA